MRSLENVNLSQLLQRSGRAFHCAYQGSLLLQLRLIVCSKTDSRHQKTEEVKEKRPNQKGFWNATEQQQHK